MVAYRRSPIITAATPSGGRGRKFESCHPDHLIQSLRNQANVGFGSLSVVCHSVATLASERSGVLWQTLENADRLSGKPKSGCAAIQIRPRPSIRAPQRRDGPRRLKLRWLRAHFFPALKPNQPPCGRTVPKVSERATRVISVACGLLQLLPSAYSKRHVLA